MSEMKIMKIAITSAGNTLESKVDSRFGRCAYFVIYDTEYHLIEILPNPNREHTDGSGPSSVQFLASKGIKKVVSGEFGAKVKSIFDSLKIQLIMVKDPEKTVAQIIELINQTN